MLRGGDCDGWGGRYVRWLRIILGRMVEMKRCEMEELGGGLLSNC